MLERLIMFDLFNGFYRGKRVLVTGHTGFKGSWLCLWLRELGAEIAGYALDPENERDNFVLSGLSADMRDIRGDIRDAAHLNRVFDEFQPEIVFHLAAQPLVRLSYEKPVETYETNVMGTIHVLEAFRRTPPRARGSSSQPTSVTKTANNCAAAAKTTRWADTIPTLPAKAHVKSPSPPGAAPSSRQKADAPSLPLAQEMSSAAETGRRTA